jgi:hypothetical protein
MPKFSKDYVNGTFYLNNQASMFNDLCPEKITRRT